MFKKKGNNNKKVDLLQEAEQIDTNLPSRRINGESSMQDQSEARADIAQEESSNGSKAPLFKKKAKANIFSLQGMQKTQTMGQAPLNTSSYAFEEQKVASSDIQLCFNEIRKLKEVEPIIEQEQYAQQPQNVMQDKPKKMTIRMEDVNLESQPEVLEIQVDEEGGFSPELNYGRTDDYDDVNGDYEDQLIKKTLTKRNYDNLSKYGGISLNKLKQMEAKDSFVQKLKKVNSGSIKKAISRDLYNKKLKLKELNETLKEISTHGGNKKQEIEAKQKRVNSLKQQFLKLGKVIEYLYYWGDRVNDFSIDAIQKNINERQKRDNTFDLDNEDDEF